jgi:DNA-binding response OmpR family regulator
MTRCAALVVEDDDLIQRLLQATLRRHCSSVETAGDGEKAIELLRAAPFDVVVLDIMLPKRNGFEVARAIGGLQPSPKLIVVSGVARDFPDRFPDGTVLLQKPFAIDQLDSALSGMTVRSA